MTGVQSDELAALLADIVFWGERLEEHLFDIEEAEFSSSPVHIDAVCWCLSCIGEASGQIRLRIPGFAASNPELELSKSYAMRNRLVHGYFALDHRVLWNAAKVSVPTLIDAARKFTDER